MGGRIQHCRYLGYVVRTPVSDSYLPNTSCDFRPHSLRPFDYIEIPDGNRQRPILAFASALASFIEHRRS